MLNIYRSMPTRRELVLVTLLLAVLLLLTRVNFDLDLRSSLWPAPKQTSTERPPNPTASSTNFEPPPPPPRTHIKWGSSQVPQTRIVAHVPGWTLFDNLYIFNGTMYIVSDDPQSVPDLKFVLSAGIPIKDGGEEIIKRLPTDKDMSTISTEEARRLFDTGADIIDGVTWLCNDPAQFITHYYHWAAELFFGFWRAYSSLDPLISSNGTTNLPPPRRMMFPHLDAGHWRDYASMNQWVLRAAFPSIVMEFSADWSDRAELAGPFVFDRILLADRPAAHYGQNYGRYQRTAAEPFALPGSVDWWSTIRNNVVESTGVRGSTGEGTRGKPVITYISRQQWGRRMLIPEHHDKLVEELYRLRDTYGYEVNVVSMDKLSRIEQIRLSARTTILMGVHGNGLTALIWMKPSPRTTVLEFFYPGGFAYDYEYTTRALGMIHYGFWGDKYFTSPLTPPRAYPEGFQGNEIPINGEVVAALVQERLSLSIEGDD